jgi:hypothetical protein
MIRSYEVGALLPETVTKCSSVAQARRELCEQRSVHAVNVQRSKVRNAAWVTKMRFEIRSSLF